MIYLIVLSIFLLAPLAAARAVCPVCTVAVCAGVGFSRWLGVDDTISGLWIGALALSASLWTRNWLNKKNIKFFGRQPLIFLAYYALIIWPLYQFGLAGNPDNRLWGVDKLILGIAAGSAGFIAAVFFGRYLKSKNQGKVFFPLQKVVLPLAMLAALSLVFYVICS